MPGEEQERFEDYLELDRYLEELDAGGTPRLPEGLTPAQARIYRMAALFRAASPNVAEPRPEFAADLEARLLQEQQSPQLPASKHTPLAGASHPRKAGFLSRRALLAGGTAIAASLAAGAAIDHAIVQATTPAQQGNSTSQWNGTSLVSTDSPTEWHLVTTLADLGEQAVPFSAYGIVGYVLRASSAGASWNGSGQEQVIALSASCTHMGCIVQWQDDRRFHCPCHGGLFNADGGVVPGASSKLYLQALPRLDTKIDAGNVYVRVPAKK